jgi:flagellar hook-length control protein FliK
MNQVMTHMRANAGEQFAELKITLRPESLGDVTLRVVTQNGIVSAQFVAESQRVKEVLESNFNQLRDVLQQQGIRVSELSVSVGQDESEAQRNQLARAQQIGQRRLQRILSRSAVEEAPEETQPIDPTLVEPSNVNYLV